MRNSAYTKLSDEQLSDIDALCDQFDRELLDGNGPAIETFLTKVAASAREFLLGELLIMEVEYRAKQGETVTKEEYLERFVRHDSLIEDAFGTDQGLEFDANTKSLSPMVGESATIGLPPVVPNFCLIEKLGEGGMGVVWLAEQERPVKRRVALKLVRAGMNSADVIARFHAEKRALAMMDHQNIAKVLDAGTCDDGRPFFVMELVQGIPITQFCDENKRSIDERLEMFILVCKALQHAHQKGIIHRDLKPSNVLVTEIDGEAVPKVIDFGLAKATEKNLRLSDVTLQTEFGKVIGTVRYMSPEQAELKEGSAMDIDTRTDVYSLGILLYELLIGCTPVDEETLSNNALLRILEIIREEDAPRPSKRLNLSTDEFSLELGTQRGLHPNRLQQILRGELDWVVMKAIEKDRNRRYQTANDLAKDLSDYLTGEPVGARPPSTWYLAQKVVRRHRGLVASMLAIVVVLIAGIFGTTYGLLRANQKTELAEKKSNEADRARGKAEAAESISREYEAVSKFQLALARFDDGLVTEARNLLHQIPTKYRNGFEWNYCHRRFQGSDITCYGHLDEISNVAFMPTGKRVVSVDKGGRIRIWDSISGEGTRQLFSDDESLFGLAIDPNGSLFASAGESKTIKIWSVSSGEILHELNGHLDRVTCLRFSPNGDRIASSSKDNTIRVWDVNTGNEIKVLTGHSDAVKSIAFSPDGSIIATSSDDQTIQIWNSRTGELISYIPVGKEEFQSLAFCPNGKFLASTAGKGFSLWRTDTWERVTHNERAHELTVRCIVFSPDGRKFATGSEDARIKLWDTRTGQLVTTLHGHNQSISAIDFSPDGSRLVSSSYDKTVKIWNVTGSTSLKLGGHVAKCTCVEFSKKGNRLASADVQGKILVRDATNCQIVSTPKGHTGAVNSLSFSADGTILCSGGSDGSIRTWDTETGDELAVMKEENPLRQITLHPGGTQVASITMDGTLSLWNAETNKKNDLWKGLQTGVTCMAFDSQGLYLATGHDNREVKLWNFKTGVELTTFSEHTGSVQSVVFSPSGDRIVSAGKDSKIRIWGVNSGNQIAKSNYIPGTINQVTFSPDGERVTAACSENAIRLFDALNGQETMSLERNVGCSSVSFRADGERIVGTDGISGNIHIWDSPREHEYFLLLGHTDEVTHVSFSADGSQIQSESKAEHLAWEVSTRKEIQSVRKNRHAEFNNISSDGRWFVKGESNEVKLVDLHYKKTPSEFWRRTTQSSFDKFWRMAQATSSAENGDWYAAVFHYGWLQRNDPDSNHHSANLRMSCRQLLFNDPALMDQYSKLKDANGKDAGVSQNHLKKKKFLSTVAANPFMESKVSNPKSKNELNPNRSLVFDGASHVELAHMPFYKESFTFQGWINPAFVGGTVFSIRSRDEKTSAISIVINFDGRLRVNHRIPPRNIGGMEILSKTRLVADDWHHLALVRDDDHYLHLYINGKLEATSHSRVVDISSDDFLLSLGLNSWSAPRFYKGLMDEVQFWNVARTEQEIINDMNAAPDSPRKGLVKHLDFNQTGNVQDFEQRMLETYASLGRLLKNSSKTQSPRKDQE